MVIKLRRVIRFVIGFSWYYIYFFIYALVWPVSRALYWSRVGRVGNSGFSKFLAFAPVIAFLIMYNSTLQGYLALSDQEFGGCLVEGADQYSDRRLDIFFLGIVMFGLASALLRIFAPSVTQEFHNSESFVSFRMESDDRTQRSMVLLFICRKLLVSYSFFRLLRLSRVRKCPGTPMIISIDADLCNHLNIMIRELIDQIKARGEAEAKDRYISFYLAKYSKISGGGTSSPACHFLLGRLGVSWAYSDRICDLLSENLRTLYRVEWEFLNRQYFLLRVVVFLMLGIGIALMLVPTLITSVYVLEKFCP